MANLFLGVGRGELVESPFADGDETDETGVPSRPITGREGEPSQVGAQIDWGLVSSQGRAIVQFGEGDGRAIGYAEARRYRLTASRAVS
jgi:hypothetical protein